jgi:hypothetical protein
MRETWMLPGLLVLLLACGCVGRTASVPAPAAPTPATAAVTSAAQLFSAIADPSVSTISVMKPFSVPHGSSKPAVVQRQLLITSPIRAMIDWCDKQCRAGNMSTTPFIVVGKVRTP